MIEGAIIEAKLIEEVELNRWIVSFQGHLVQVKNTTGIKFEEGKRLHLKVISSRPLQLSVVGLAKTPLFSIDRMA